nr:MAG: L2 protein [Betta papillomavirus 1]
MAPDNIRYHMKLDKNGTVVYERDPEGWLDKVSRWFAALLFTGGAPGISAEVLEAYRAGQNVAAGVSTTGLAEEIPLAPIGESASHDIFTPPENVTVESHVDVVHDETLPTDVVHSRDEVVVFDKSEARPRTSTPIGKPPTSKGLRNKPVEHETNLDYDEEVNVVSRGRNNEDLVIAKPTVKPRTRSGRPYTSWKYRTISTIEAPEPEPETLEMEDFSYRPEEPLQFKSKWKPKDGTNWGRWHRGNWSFGYTKKGFHLRYKKVPVKYHNGKIYIYENGKWNYREIPKSLSGSIDLYKGVIFPKPSPDRHSHKKASSHHPGRHLLKSIHPVVHHDAMYVPKKRKCKKRVNGRCVQFS